MRKLFLLTAMAMMLVIPAAAKALTESSPGPVGTGQVWCSGAHYSNTIDISPSSPPWSYYFWIYTYTGSLVSYGPAGGHVTRNFGTGATRYVCIQGGSVQQWFLIDWRT